MEDLCVDLKNEEFPSASEEDELNKIIFEERRTLDRIRFIQDFISDKWAMLRETCREDYYPNDEETPPLNSTEELFGRVDLFNDLIQEADPFAELTTPQLEILEELKMQDELSSKMNADMTSMTRIIKICTIAAMVIALTTLVVTVLNSSWIALIVGGGS